MTRSPDEWQRTRLDAVANTFSGGTPARENPSFFGGGIPWVKSGEVNLRAVRGTEETISQAALSGSSARLAPPGSVLVAMYGATAGKVAVLEIEAAINQAILAVVPREAVAHGSFLFHALEFETPHILRKVQGSGQPNLSGAILRGHDFALPPLGEQRKIAAILSSVDDAIEATQAVIDQLQVVKKAMMAELLTRGLPGRHTRFRTTEIGEVPDEWAVATLGAITRASAFGPRFPATQYSELGNVGTVRTTDLTEDWEIDYATIPTATVDANVMRPHLLEDGDLLVSRSGTCGVVTVFRKQLLDMVPAAFLIRFRLDSSVDAEFVRLAMMVPSAQARIQAMAAGGVQKNLSGTNLATLRLPLPPLSEQREIVSAVDAVDARLRVERALNQQRLVAKSALMSALLTGEMRVSPEGEQG